MTFTLPDDIAIKLGAKRDPSQQPEAQPYSLMEESIPLWGKVQGTSAYQKRLNQAAAELYGMMEIDPTIQHYATTGKKVMINGKERGVIVPFTDSRRPKTIMALEHLLHSLAYIASHPQTNDGKGVVRNLRYVGVSMRKMDYSQTQFKHLEYQSVVGAVYSLSVMASIKGSNEGLIEFTAGRYSKAAQHGLRTRIRPLRPMLDWMVERGLIFAGHPDQKRRKFADELLLRVRDLEEKDLVTPLSRPLNASEAILPELNERLSRQRLDIQWPDYETYIGCWDFKAGWSKANLSGRRTLWRQFVGQDGHGGRLIGHCVQQLPRKARKYLLIDGMPTAEADYNAMQLRLLYAAKGMNAPSGDLYECSPTVQRELMKAVLTVSVGCRSRDETVQALRKHLYEMGETSNHSAENLYDTFWSYHVGLCPHDDIDTAAWKRLQNAESEIVLRVSARLLDADFVAVPIHDSFVAQERNIAVVKREMEAGFRDLYPNASVSVTIKHRRQVKLDSDRGQDDHSRPLEREIGQVAGSLRTQDY